MSPALADPALYAEVYKEQIQYIRSVIVQGGCPVRYLDDVTSEVILAIIKSDGLSRFDPEQGSIRAYLWLYVNRVAKHALSRILIHEARQAVLDFDVEDEPVDYTFDRFLDALLAASADDDAREFILAAVSARSYRQARADLVAQGWESNRIRRAVRRARSSVRSCL